MRARRKSRSGENVTFCGGKRESFLKSESGCQKCVVVLGYNFAAHLRRRGAVYCSNAEKKDSLLSVPVLREGRKKRKTNLKGKLRVVALGKSKFPRPFLKFLQKKQACRGRLTADGGQKTKLFGVLFENMVCSPGENRFFTTWTVAVNVALSDFFAQAAEK